MFKLEDCIIRIARGSDKQDLEAIARTIWGGNDYLPRIIKRWIKERWFFVAEYHGRVIACIKLSEFPGDVIWIEGLRVHSRYQGKGLGSLLNAYIMDYAYKLRDKNPRLVYEFCTYYLNVESMRMTQNLGFEVVESFYNLARRGVITTKAPEILQDYSMDLFKAYPTHIPLGWQSVHNKPSSLDFIKRWGKVFKTPQSTYLYGGVGDTCVTFLEPPVQDLASELAYFQHFFGSRKSIAIILPVQYESYLPQLKEAGFYFWDDDKKEAKNMLVKRLT